MIYRQQYQHILKDIDKKMAFIVGPRQSGKTSLAKAIGESFEKSVYLNYDHLEDRALIIRESWHPSTELVILDELHKMDGWKNYLKGLYDTKPESLRILVTGSARLDIAHHVGDSLAGRYFLHHLLPLSPAELTHINEPVDIERLIARGGFPEPYLDDSDVDAERWRNHYVDSVLQYDVLDFHDIPNVNNIRTVFELLRRRVGSPISYQSIAEDTALAPNTVKKYIQILESLYIIFRVIPFSRDIARSLLKEPKIYFFDTGLVKGDEGAKFENFVALCLKKHVYGLIDYQAKPYGLYYLRTKDKQEVDFAVTCDQQIEVIIEAKHTSRSVSKELWYFHQKYQLPAIQLVQQLKANEKREEIEILSAKDYLTSLAL